MSALDRRVCHGAPKWMILGAMMVSPWVGAQSLPLSAQDRAQIESVRRQTAPPVGVEDLIGLTTFGSASVQGAADRSNFTFSPDQKQVAVVVQRGNVPRNTRDFSLLIFRTDELLKQPKPSILAQFSTQSNRPGIANVQWLDDNATVAFMGERPGEHTQVYSIGIHTRELTQLTQAQTPIEAYTLDGSGKTIVYIAQPPKPDPQHEQRMRERGFVVSPEIPLFNLVAGDWTKVSGNRAQGLHVVRAGRDTYIPVPLPEFDTAFKGCKGSLLEEASAPLLVISPDGNSTLVRCSFVDGAPTSWNGYRQPAAVDKVLMRAWESWRVVDLRSGETRALIDAPAFSGIRPRWLADGRRVRLFDEVLPLEGVDEAAQVARATQTFDADVDTQTGEITNVSLHKASAEAAQPVQLEIRQGPNQPWALVAKDPRGKAQRTVYDPNAPLFSARRFAHVTAIPWTTRLGTEYQAYLYWPTDYLPGRRYPLVFQTRGVRVGDFLPNGLSTTGQAAQPLAGSGILVIQGMQCVKNCENTLTTPERSYLRYQDQIEGAIDELARLELIDRTKVALQGWSMSCMHVMQMLTQSSYPIAAALGSDCRTDDYMVHLAQAPLWRANTDWFARMKGGGEPFGDALKRWMERAPGFNLHKVKTPLMLEALGPEWFQGVLSEWEFYAGLLLQDKPVELFYLPQAYHSVIKPWERVTSQQTAVDWYRFWLQDFERITPITAVGETTAELTAKYQRWRKLREKQHGSAQSAAK